MDTVPARVSAAATSPKRDTTRKHIRGSSLLLIGRFVSLGLNFVIQVLTVRYLSKSDFGAFSYALSVASMGASVALFGLDKAVTRFVPIYQEQRRYARMFGALLLMVGTVLGIGISLVMIVLGLQGILGRSFVSDPLSLALLLILIALAPTQALDSLFQGMLAVFASPTAIFFRRHLLGPGLKLAAVLLVLFARGDVYLLAFGYLIGGLFGEVVYVLMILQVLRERGLLHHFDPGRIQWPVRETFGFSIPLLTTDVVYILRSSAVVMLLEFFRGTRDVAEFRAVIPVAGLNLVVMQSFKFLYTPMAARLFARDDKAGINDLYWRTAIWIAVFSFPVFVVSFALAQPLTVLLFGSRYAQSGIILALLSLGNYFNAAVGFNSYTLRVYGKVRYIVVIDLLAALLGLGLNLWLIPAYGELGAAVGTCIALIAHNLLNHTGLLLGTGIDLFQWRYLRVYASIIVAAVGMLLVQTLFNPPLAISGALVVFVSLSIVRLNHKALNVGQMFPELRRIPVLRPFLGL
ncbi:MAG: oligosaccharide flippase family protein [Chloroflexi bacterium]|nr:oligosaccharide flippase family protein [Chloroflexota bacterium]MCI0575261.1 oligosaccharide flippase family protein [Chloroflexota bacterium]MCI0731238.1 oligosaccharide flippase family protein [Chloroflexota bacterium]